MSKKPLITKNEMMLVQNSITGEIESANVKVSVYVTKDTPKFKNEPFTMLFQKLGIVTAKSIKPVTAKLLLYLCACVEYGNVVGKGTEQIAEELGYSTRNVQRALLELEELKIIIKDKNATDKRMSVIYLNPYQSWKGKPSDRTKKIAEYNDNNQLDMFKEKETKKIQPNDKFLINE
jgi:predicted transcriptional regulator